MINQTSDKRRNVFALIVLTVSALLIFGYSWVLDPLLTRWESQKAELEKRQQTIARLQAAVSPDRFDRKIIERTGKLELPADELTQKILFKRKLEEQFRQAGVGIDGDPQFDTKLTPLTGTPYKLARLSLTGRAKHNNLLNLADKIYDNPYLAGLEEFSIELQGNNRNADDASFKIKVTVTTLMKS